MRPGRSKQEMPVPTEMPSPTSPGDEVEARPPSLSVIFYVGFLDLLRAFVLDTLKVHRCPWVSIGLIRQLDGLLHFWFFIGFLYGFVGLLQDASWASWSTRVCVWNFIGSYEKRGCL